MNDDEKVLVARATGDGFTSPMVTLRRHLPKRLERGFVEVERADDGTVSEVKAKRSVSSKPKPEEGDTEENS